MERLTQDFRYALRILRKNPLFAIVAVVTLGLGIGVNTAIFSIANQLFLQPLPGIHPEQVVRLYPEENRENVQVASYPKYVALSQHARSLQYLAAHSEASVSLGSSSGPTSVKAEVVTGSFFQVFGINAVIGRTILPNDDRQGAAPVAVISYRLWKNNFQQSPEVLSEKIYLNGHPFDIIGVAPKSFLGSYLTADTDIWTAMATHEQVRPRGIPITNANWEWLNLTGRLANNVTMTQAQSEFDRLSREIKIGSKVTFRLVKASWLPESLSKNLTKALLFLGVISGLIMLVICANVAGALLPHAVARRRETAIRSSLGASQLRLVRQWLTESCTIALFGGLVGVFVAIWCKEGLKSLLPPEWQSFVPALAIDLSVILFAIGASIVTGILCGLAPAFQIRKGDLVTSLKEDNTSPSRHRLFGIFIAAQTAVSFVLLIVAALLLRSFVSSSKFDAGFDTDRLLVATVDTQRQSYTDERSLQFFNDFTKRLSSLEGIRAVSYATVTPLGFGRESRGFMLSGTGNRSTSISYNSVGPNYFKTLGIPLIRGRDFSDDEIRGAGTPVVIINQTMAKKYWPAGDPIGQRIQLTGESELEIIGIAKDIQYYTIGEEPQSYVYLTPATAFIGQMTMQIRTAGDPENLAKTVVNEIASIDPNLAPFDVLSFAKLRSIQLFPIRALATISLLTGILALILTALGIYGIVSYSVTQRTKEIGLRMALGASHGSIAKLVLQHGLKSVVLGALIGFLAAFFTTRLLSAVLFQVSPTDELSFLGVTSIVFLIALAACWIPARRAMKVEPLTALRYE